VVRRIVALGNTHVLGVNFVVPVTAQVDGGAWVRMGRHEKLLQRWAKEQVLFDHELEVIA
jgi:hypothetical protein